MAFQLFLTLNFYYVLFKILDISNSSRPIHLTNSFKNKNKSGGGGSVIGHMLRLPYDPQ